MSGILPGRGHNKGGDRTMHSPRMAAVGGGIALPEDLAKEQAMAQAIIEQRNQMVIQVRTQAAVEIMAALVCQSLNANVVDKKTLHLKADIELDSQTLKATLDRAAEIATHAADSLVCEMYGVTIQRQPIETEELESQDQE